MPVYEFYILASGIVSSREDKTRSGYRDGNRNLDWPLYVSF